MQLTDDTRFRLANSVADIFALVPQLSREVIPHLRKRGWHPMGQMTIPFKRHLITLANAGDYDGLDIAMESAARHYLDEIETDVVSRFPNRREILNDAFDAHRNHKYTLSVPAMLIQADGIGTELLEKVDYFFRDGKSNERAFNSLGIRTGGLADILLEALRKPPVFLPRRQSIDSTIDRNEVLHGKDTSYHTEPNSLRAVVLLGYLTDAFDMINRWRQSEKEFRDEIQAFLGQCESKKSDSGA